jgi:hypothetical protein
MSIRGSFRVMNGGNDLMREAARLHVARLGNVGAPAAAPGSPVGEPTSSSPAAASSLVRRQVRSPDTERRGS